MTLVEIAETVGRFIAVYVGIAVLAHGLHLFGGVLAVGTSEVRRQVSETYAALGPRRYVVFVLTMGFYQPRDLDLEPEIVDYPGGDEL